MLLASRGRAEPITVRVRREWRWCRRIMVVSHRLHVGHVELFSLWSLCWMQQQARWYLSVLVVVRVHALGVMAMCTVVCCYVIFCRCVVFCRCVIMSLHMSLCRRVVAHAVVFQNLVNLK